MSRGVQCQCGRFLADAHPVVGVSDGWAGGPFVSEVRGNCSRCGGDVEAAPGWWGSWDAWTWSEATS